MMKHVGLLQLLLLTSTLAGVPASAHALQTVTIDLKAETTIAGRHVTLSDVATLTSVNSSLVEQLGNMRVGNAPRVGYASRLSRGEIERFIRPQVASAFKAEWSGAGAVTIRTATQTISASLLIDTALRHLSAELAKQTADPFIEPASTLDDIEVPTGTVTFRPRPLDSKHMAARMPVWVDVYVDEVPYRAVVVPFSVNATHFVYVAKRDLPEGSVVTAEDFETKQVEMAFTSQQAGPVTQFGGMVRMRKRLGAGQTLHRNQIAPEGTIYPGDPVQLIVANAGVLIETRATAQQEGTIGQIVRVKMENATEAVSARIIAPGLVQAGGR